MEAPTPLTSRQKDTDVLAFLVFSALHLAKVLFLVGVCLKNLLLANLKLKSRLQQA